MIIKIKCNNSIPIPRIYKKGDWIDLYSSEDIILNHPKINNKEIIFDTKLISLGIQMKLPKGFEALLAPRSSSFKEFGIIQINSPGIIDNSYCGNNDTWKFQVLSLSGTKIKKGDSICQFRIQLSQNASFWQKIKWLFSRKIKFKIVDNLSNNDRGGFGTTNKLKI